jgi:hypothetical protein
MTATPDLTWEWRCLARLRTMLQSLMRERDDAGKDDPTRAAHLADAVMDLRALIEHVEARLDGSINHPICKSTVEDAGSHVASL